MTPAFLRNTLWLVILLCGCASNPLLNQINPERMLSDQTTARQRDSNANDYELQIANGKSQERLENLDEARKIYEKLIVSHPGRAEVYHRLGVIADHRKDFDRAQNFLSQAIRLDAKNAEIWCDLGFCLYLKGELEQAENALRKASTLSPDDPRIHNNLGLIFGNLGRAEEALAEFQKGGSEADAHFNLAFVYATQNENEKATACIERVLELDPDHKKARRALANFAAVKQTGDVTPDAVDDKVRTRWIPYIEGSGNEDATSLDKIKTTDGSYQQVSPNRTAGNRVRRLQSRAEALMNARLDGRSSPTSHSAERSAAQ